MSGARRQYAAVSAVVLLLGLALLGFVAAFWITVIEPRIKAEAISQAEVLARSQASVLAHALLSPPAERNRNVVRTMDELLLLRDPATKMTFFRSLELQVDYSVVQSEDGTLDLRRGDMTQGGFRTEVAIYNPDTDELLGVASFQVSDRFFHQLSRDLRKGLWTVLLTGLAVLVVLWAALILILRKLDRQTEKYERLVNNLSTYFVYGRDAEGKVTFVSESAQRVLGFEPEALLGRMPVKPPSEGAERVYSIEIEDASGDVHHIELSEVRTGGGYDGIARDFTSQRLFEEELRHAKEQAEAANRAKSQFLANMSHEIRTPLNAIAGMTALALKSETSPRVRNHLDKIRSSAHLLAELIEDILDLSRIEAGRLEIQRIDFDLDDMLAEVADVVGVRVGEKNLEILFSTAADVPRRLRGDPVRVKQILLNLLGNALKFTSSGEIVVEISTVEVRRDRAELRVSVRDTGIGIAPENLSRLFEPFTQVDASMTRRFGGAGLGLAISRRLVAMMGGELLVESTPGQGTTFSFTLPFEVSRGPSGPRRLSDEFRDLPVLVADDNTNARIVIADMLRSLSCRVTSAQSGEEAVALARRASEEGTPFKLAVLDWKMPGIDGAETAQLLRQSDPLSVILVTAYDREDAQRRAERAGIQVVLHKPVSPSTLHDAVIRVLHPGSAHVEPRAAAPRRFAPGQKVLVVEDNAINREVAREMLTQAGLEVSEAFNGLEALQMLGKQTFDLVMMDVQMPELDGIEAVRAIRANERLRELPVIAITAHAMLGDRERFIEAGMSDYVSKPIDEDQLMKVLARYLTAGDDVASPTTTLDVSAGIRQASGNTALYERLVQRFRDENESTIPRLREIVARGDREEALRMLHTLKGSAATLGARELADAAATVEAALRVSSRAQSRDLLPAGDPSTPLGMTPDLDDLALALDAFRAAAARIPVRQAGENGGARNVTIEEVKPLLDQLAQLLPQNNLGALEAFQELKKLVGNRQSVTSLEDALDRLDFQSAIPHLQTLEKELIQQP